MPPKPPSARELDTIERLVREGALPDDAIRWARARRASAPRLARWVELGALAMGAGLILAGVVFFFAFNWAEMHRFAKLGLVQGLMFSGVAGAALTRHSRPLVSSVLLTSAAVLVGVFFAVYGQIYQTGADAWGLFAAWSVLSLAWVSLARSQGAWIIWSIVTHLAIILCGVQVLSPKTHLFVPTVTAASMLLTGAMIAAREAALSELDARWLAPKWGFQAVVGVGLLIGSVPASVLAAAEFFSLHSILSTLVFAGSCAGITLYAIMRARDVILLGQVGVAVSFYAFCISTRLAVEIFEFWSIFVMGGYLIANAAIYVVTMKAFIEIIGRDPSGDEEVGHAA